jgi:DNA polymerase III epsilon subunit-like protein
VAHNAYFDRAHLLRACAEAHVPGLAAGPFLCTLQLARKAFPRAPSHKLYALASSLGLCVSPVRHRALPDAELAAALFVRLLSELRAQAAALGLVGELDAPALCALQRSRAKRLTHSLPRALGATDVRGS